MIGIKNQILDALKTEDKREFIRKLSETGELLFFGGVPRDIVLIGDTTPRDFDIVIDFTDEEKFKQLIKQYPYRINSYGGFKVFVNGIEFDLWNLSKTWAFKGYNIEVSQENLTKTVFLNLDGIVYNYNKDILYDNEFNQAIENKEISVIIQENPKIVFNLYRALVMRDKYKHLNLKLSKTLVEMFIYYYKRLKDELINQMYEKQYRRYEYVKYTREELKKIIEEITEGNNGK